MKKITYKAAIVAAAVLTAAGLTACTQTQPASTVVQAPATAERDIITVSSTEQVKVVPDIAELNYSIYTQAADAQTCQQQNAEDLQKVTDLLKSLGVQETSIQTSDFSLNPRYDWSGETQKLIGYEMTTRLTVSDLPIDQVGSILAQSVDNGVNTIDSITYKSSQYDANYEQALKQAIESARVKAEAMAAAGGCTLGKVAQIEEYASNQATRYTNYSMKDAVPETARAGGSVNVMPGQVSVEARVSVAYYIQ